MNAFLLLLLSMLKRLSEKIRKALLRRGYGCDSCGEELFDYPAHRLCRACEDKLRVPKNPCPLCGREGRAEGLCLDCKSRPPTFTGGASAFVYVDEAATLANRMKESNPRLAAYFGERTAEAFLNRYGKEEAPFLVVAIPTTKDRLQRRGYNQAERLAESVCEYLNAQGVEAIADFEVLHKTKETKLQKRSSQRERIENVKGAYHVHKRKACKGKRILLVDDIMTTGATGSECARKLLLAGAEKVYFLTATAVPEQK